jgi:hypothetical protein
MKPTEDLNDVLEDYEIAAEDQDHTIIDLKDELDETDEAISDEKERLSSPVENPPKSNVKVSVGVLADFEGAINIALIYSGSFFLPVY